MHVFDTRRLLQFSADNGKFVFCKLKGYFSIFIMLCSFSLLFFSTPCFCVQVTNEVNIFLIGPVLSENVLHRLNACPLEVLVFANHWLKLFV